jgi:Tfp pilus assembly protein PilN
MGNMAMIKINLLPKQYQKRSGGFSIGKHGKYAIATVAGVIMMLGTITTYQVLQMNELKEQMKIARMRTQQLQKDIELVDALTDIKQKITNRLEAVERLDRHRSAWVKILEEVAHNVPDFVWLSSFAETNAAGSSTVDTSIQAQTAPSVKPVEIEGFTFTLNALATFMIKMMRSNYFDEVDMANVEEISFGKQKAYNFKIDCNVHYLSDEELEKNLTQVTDSSNAG